MYPIWIAPILSGERSLPSHTANLSRLLFIFRVLPREAPTREVVLPSVTNLLTSSRSTKRLLFPDVPIAVSRKVGDGYDGS